MTPLIFISIVIVVLSLLIYWVMSTINDQPRKRAHKIPYDFRHAYDFETAPELAVYPENEIYLGANSIKLVGKDAAHLRAYWHLDKNYLEEEAHEANILIDPLNLVLRLYESSDLLRYHDIQVENMKGRCRLQLQPFNAYYVSLGIVDNKRFIPLLTSNTVIKQK